MVVPMTPFYNSLLMTDPGHKLDSYKQPDMNMEQVWSMLMKSSIIVIDFMYIHLKQNILKLI